MSSQNSSIENVQPSVEQSRPQVTEYDAQFTLSDHIVDGVGRGSLSDLSFRPNATFHPVREVKVDRETCLITFDKPLQSLNRSLSKPELLLLLKNLRSGVRECALGQQLYLYPGIEAFGMTQQGDICFTLINVRPRYSNQDHSTQKMSVLAFFELMKVACPSGWRAVEGKQDRINTLAALEVALEGSSLLTRIAKVIRFTLISALVLTLAAVFIGLFGPPELREPLREWAHPHLVALSEHLSPESAKVPAQETVVPEMDEDVGAGVQVLDHQ